MKSRPSSVARQSAFTLIETMIATAVVAITGILIYYVLLSGLTLFTKNTAINMAHQEARAAVLQMEQDIHSAVSIPTLTTTSPTTAVSGSGPAAGIAFQVYAAGPFQITPNSAGHTTLISTNTYGYAAGQSTIWVRCNGYVPQLYQRLIVPDFQTELTVIGIVAGSGATDTELQLGTDLGVAATLPFAVTVTMNNTATNTAQNVNVQCFFTDRVAYTVNGNQLLYWPRQFNNTGNPTPTRTLATSITSPTPFSIPATPLGAPFNRFVTAINLITADTQTTNLNFRAANMFLNSMEPYRARLCMYQ